MRRIWLLKRRTLPKPAADATLVEGERRLVEQLLREVHAPRERHLERRRAEVLQEQAPQMARGDAEPIGQLVDAVRVERALADQPQRRATRAPDVPSQAGVPGDASGRQRRHGRNPAASAAAAVGK